MTVARHSNIARKPAPLKADPIAEANKAAYKAPEAARAWKKMRHGEPLTEEEFSRLAAWAHRWINSDEERDRLAWVLFESVHRAPQCRAQTQQEVANG